jgi:hypothetical protein
VKQIRAANGVLYFPTREAAEAFAQHCGITNPSFGSCLKGWYIKQEAA